MLHQGWRPCREARQEENMKTGLNTALDPSRRSADAQGFETAIRRKIVGQDQAVEKVVEIYQMFLAGLKAPGRPAGNLRLLRPPGSGDTRLVQAMAEAPVGAPPPADEP